MKKTVSLLSFSIAITMMACGPYPPQPAVVVQSPTPPVPVATVQQVQPIDQDYSNYQFYDDGGGGQVFYYRDPYLNTWFYLTMDEYNYCLRNRVTFHNYYIGHRYSVDHNYSFYHTRYTHVYYDSKSDRSRSFYRPSVPSGKSTYTSGATSTYRPSVPSGRTPPPPSTTATTRQSVPTGRTVSPAPTFRPSSPSSGSRTYSPSPNRSSVPSGGSGSRRRS